MITDSMGQLCARKQDFKTAEEVYQRALEIKEEALGRGHSSFAFTLDHLAQAKRQQFSSLNPATLPHYHDAKVRYEKAFAIFKKTLGATFNLFYSITDTLF